MLCSCCRFRSSWAFVWCCVSRLRRSRLVLAILVVRICSLGVVHLLMRWQAWLPRLHAPPLALAATPAATALLLPCRAVEGALGSRVWRPHAGVPALGRLPHSAWPHQGVWATLSRQRHPSLRWHPRKRAMSRSSSWRCLRGLACGHRVLEHALQRHAYPAPDRAGTQIHRARSHARANGSITPGRLAAARCFRDRTHSGCVRPCEEGTVPQGGAAGLPRTIRAHRSLPRA